MYLPDDILNIIYKYYNQLKLIKLNEEFKKNIKITIYSSNFSEYIFYKKNSRIIDFYAKKNKLLIMYIKKVTYKNNYMIKENDYKFNQIVICIDGR